MKVEGSMTRDVQTVRTSDWLDVAVRKMRDHRCGCIVVVDEPGFPVGIITDRDVAITALETHKPLDAIPASRAMSRPLFTARTDAALTDALALMERHRVRRLPVVDGSGRLAGVISLDDIAIAAERARGRFTRATQAKRVGLALAWIGRPLGIGAKPS